MSKDPDRQLGEVRIRVEGFAALLKKLSTADPIYVKPWREALEKATVSVERQAKRRAPVATGKLQASITHRMDAKPVPEWGRVTAGAESASGFRYPFALEAGRVKRKSGKVIELHYRQGPQAGKSTKAWMFGALVSRRKLIRRLLDRAAERIEAMWRTR